MRKPVDLELPREPDLSEIIPDGETSADPLAPPPPTRDVAKKTLPVDSHSGHLLTFIKDELPKNPEAGDAVVKEVTRQVKDVTLSEPMDPYQYPMSHDARGIFILFNVVNFGHSLAKRVGTDEDADQMVRTFELMDFKVIRVDDPKAIEMVKILKTGIWKLIMMSSDANCWALSIANSDIVDLTFLYNLAHLKA